MAFLARVGVRACYARRPMTVNTDRAARLDMGQPLDGEAVRLRHTLGQPAQVLQAHTANELVELLHQLENAARQGWWCVGGLRYEAASALRPELVTQPCAAPLAWFGLYPAPPQDYQNTELSTQDEPVITWENTVNSEDFSQAMQAIHAGIAAGQYYQINYTQQVQGRAAEPVDGAALFAALQQAQPGGYALYVDMGQEQIASVSPELFFDWHQPATGSGHILTRPMKGTAARGVDAAQDAAQARHLQTSVKERAENVMIVDLLRNDLGQIAQTGSVQVPSLFNVQALPTVWQMTSDVLARLPQGTRLLEVLQALFPCGSVTGAPKRAAMQAIAALEVAPRGWYCGALGVVRPDGAGGIRATFNVPIRTVVVQGATQQTLHYGIGSGITADATVAGEWAEWHNKRALIDRVSAPFDVVTTMALDNGQFRHLALHRERMRSAAQHFGFPFSGEALDATLQHVADTHPSGLWRVRMALNRYGLFSSQVVVCPPSPEQVLLQLAPAPLREAHSEFVRFKTSRRSHYQALEPKEAHIWDTILWNEAGEITETTRGNVAALLDGRWVTPALSCGLLNGVGRQVALAQGRMAEGILRVEDIPRVQQWAFINSLRGWMPARV